VSRPRVLVVDDDPPIRELMRNILREFGMDPLVAGSGEEAVELARTETPEVILLDLNMPGLSGEETIAALRAVDALAEIPILILSGEPMDPAELERLGARGAVQKPFDLPRLIEEIRQAVV
jgi:two-component system, OmpR family, response regulator